MPRPPTQGRFLTSDQQATVRHYVKEFRREFFEEAIPDYLRTRRGVTYPMFGLTLTWLSGGPPLPRFSTAIDFLQFRNFCYGQVLVFINMHRRDLSTAVFTTNVYREVEDQCNRVIHKYTQMLLRMHAGMDIPPWLNPDEPPPFRWTS